MSKALVKRSDSPARGLLSGGASLLLPGAGQFINGESDKALGVFAVWLVAGAGIIGAIPLIGAAAWAVGAATHVYAVADGYVTGKKKR